MSNWFEKRKIRKERIVKEVKQDKAAYKKEKEEISQLPEIEQKTAKDALKEKRKEKKQAQKVAIKAMPKGAEKKEAKAKRRIYRKVKNRPIRATVWGLVIIGIGTLAVKVGPTVRDISDTVSAKGIDIVTDTPENDKARKHGEKVSEDIANEGIILLKNDDKQLPLKDKKINVFGTSSFNFRYGGGGSGGSDTSRAIDLYQGLKEAGIEYNTHLYDAYQELPEVEKASDGGGTGLVQVVKSMISKSNSDEPGIEYLTPDIVKEAKDYSDEAMIVIASSGVESSDMSKEELELTDNMKDLISTVAKDFDNITVVINAGNALELGYLEEVPQVKSIVWVGTPGPYGARSLGNVLAGNINPSGRLVDTYAYDLTSAPATENFGSYAYDNLDKHFVNYQEGIYIGYRFYETYFDGDEKGYQETVQFPLGYGLSYTDFKWEIEKEAFNETDISMDVKVTNTGDMAGKDVVQLYFSAPYTKGGIEKSAIELADFAKTKELAPGESEVVTLSYKTNDMASYDMHDEEAFVLDEGKYQIKLGKNVHEIVETKEYNNPKRVVIKEDSATGEEIKNLFTNSDNGLTYLSRSDWEGTYPTDEEIDMSAPDFAVEEANRPITPTDIDMPEVGQDKGIKLEDLKGLEYDDPKWDEFMSQFTVDELMDYYTQGAYKTNEISRLGVPGSVLLDGPAGINFFFKSVTAASYPTEVVLASTWNTQLAYDIGEAVGEEAKAMGVHGWYAPAMNIHRTPQGGRNFEYYSEDPLLSGKMATAVTKGSQDQGVMVFMKHFAMNDQETHARSGLYVWANEQSMRELHLRPFEMTVKDGGTHGVMSSFSYINGQWAGANPTLLNDLLRDEWGFNGMVSSDAVFGFMHADKAVTSGNDVMLDIMSKSTNKKRLKKAYKEDPAGIATGLQTSGKNVMYALLQTNAVE